MCSLGWDQVRGCCWCYQGGIVGEHGLIEVSDSAVGVSMDAPPVITLGLTDEGGIDEGAATFFCKATGDPAPTFEWYRNKKKVRGLRYQIVETEGGSVLRITPLRLDRDNDQSVVCEASNDDGTATTQARLTVTQVLYISLPIFIVIPT
ncbi:receptor-type tyrosine-protein phosphatase S-like [Strongylocentrotus purpuratus]|uniref:Ig-like domain-containing protein n=1 Tax=Strongylocentrotus purpuratus TaxID=7668 RepID=A0A7M7PJQ4_STRPU|nr:receptor-type tyrosine-protein phosphatase S-like [Strongylocentrotus purpuratus]